MSMTTIRRFRVNSDEFRHAIDLTTDEVFLQRYNGSADRPEDEWQSLLRYDPHCGVWEMGGKYMGHFHIEDMPDYRNSRWVFVDADSDERVVCEHSRMVESLLASEVTISKRWLAQQQEGGAA